MGHELVRLNCEFVSLARSESVVNQLLEAGYNAATFVLGLHHQDVDHVEFRIDPEVSAAAAVPLQFADVSRCRRVGISPISTDCKAVTETEAIAREVKIITTDAGTRPDMI